jgi:phosphatidylglycerophosphatase A
MRTIATVGGIGYVPKIPGTLGSAVGLLVAWMLSGNPWHQAVGSMVAIALAFWSSGPTARILKQRDPPCVVIDELAGMMLAVVWIPVSWRTYLAGFLLFRLLDVTKPPPIHQLQRLPGCWGIVLDDLASGVAVHIFLRIFLNLTG